MPNIEDILSELGNSQFFSCFDLVQGFHQVEIFPPDRKKTAFSTNFGHYEWVRTPFGLKNAPPTFQRLVDQVLLGLQGVECFVYVDDVIVHARSLEEHNAKIRRLFDRLSEAKLTLHPEKCEFLRDELNYLGHRISKDGVSPDPAKISVVKNYPRPKSTKEVRGFLRFCNYYRKFVKNFSEIAKPLAQLTSKNKPFTWGDEHDKAFNILKDRLCNEPILLQYPDFNKEFTLTTDASNVAVGSILSQQKDGFDHPVADFSKTLS